MEPDRTTAEGSPLHAALTADLNLSVSTLPQLRALSATARTQGRAACLYLKVDTGMLCDGAIIEGLPTLTVMLRRAEGEGMVDIVGLWPHLPCVDEPAGGSIKEHLKYYRRAEQVVFAAGLNPPAHHLAATGGLLWYPQARIDLVRAGIGMYGLSPGPSMATGAELGLQPTTHLESPPVQIRRIETGQAISYGGIWNAPVDRQVGFMSLGHFNDIPRAAGSADPMEVGSLITSVVGRVCMDQIVIDLGPAMDETGAPLPVAARVGDTAVF